MNKGLPRALVEHEHKSASRAGDPLAGHSPRNATDAAGAHTLPARRDRTRPTRHR
ncbi:hypothetical protein CP97_14926 (plasmid) [Aurantiacibacter atlanticus]|uniref:Uncharacterized protein n=1 Tax=Aurantiacibacter atlanticus TaxID=1648404 RepID=A0A160HUH3_9SPHN|nr:hypothetical protein CP97_14926 [Aurantiacibacter atlanticus]